MLDAVRSYNEVVAVSYTHLLSPTTKISNYSPAGQGGLSTSRPALKTNHNETENLLRFHEAVQRVLGCGGGLHYLLGGVDDTLCQVCLLYTSRCV